LPSRAWLLDRSAPVAASLIDAHPARPADIRDGRCQGSLTGVEIDESALAHARRAWRRLLGAADEHADDAGADPLRALADLGTVRRLLDQLELAAVRTARAHGRSWAEIATQLGVSRQSAWERWRDLDDHAAGAAIDRAARDVVRDLARTVPRALRRAPEAQLVTVPDVVGLPCDDALGILREIGLIPVGHNPGATPEPIGPAARGTVVDQVPKAGAQRRAGSNVTLWLDEGGGSAGVREPRRPKPSPRVAREERDTIAG
jgi:hypothetical protein